MGTRRLSRILQRTIAVRDRVARARRWPACPSGSGSRPRIRWRSAARGAEGVHAIRYGLAFFFALVFVASAQAQVLSSRIWPARDYTRLTLESKSEIKHSIFAVKDPERLVLELQTDELSPALAELQGKVSGDDPYIQGLRVGRNRPGVIRVVLDLKTDVKPQVFTLPPIAEYGHRLVLDIYPAVPIDPLAVLIEQTEKRPVEEEKEPKPSVVRLATIVI